MKNIHSLRILLTLSFFFLISTSFALTRYWRGTGANAFWNNNNNWSASSGGGTGVSFPTGADIAIFDAGGNNPCTINVSSGASTLTVTSGYTNTITQGTGNSFNIGAGGASLSGGTFAGGNSSISCSGSFTISGMAFTSTSTSLGLNGSYTLSSGSFTHNNGTVVFSTTASITGSTTFYNLIFATLGAGSTYTISGGTIMTVANTLTIGVSNAITIDTGEIDAQGNITVTNTNSGGGGSALIKINGTGNQTLTGSGVANTGKLPKIEINKASGTLTFASIISLANDWTYVTGATSNGSGTPPAVDACASLNMDCQGSGSTMAFYDLTIYGGTTTLTGNMGVSHNLTINSSQTLSGSSYTIFLDGKWDNNGTFTYSTSTVQLQGTALQTINTGSSTESFYNLVVNKTSGRVLLNDPLIINNAVTFTEGIIKASGSNYFKVVDNATATGGNDSSFVYGYYKKVGNEAFTFALGDTSLSTGGYHPLGIGAPSSGTDAYTAQYFNTTQTQGGARDSILNYTSICEHWNLARDVGSSNVTVKLGWNSTSCNIDSLDDLRVAYWNGSKWKDKGGSYTGNSTIGDVITSSAQSGFGYFIIAKKYPAANAGVDISLVAGFSVNLNGSPGASYNWAPSTWLSCTNCYNPTATPYDTITYTYTVTYPSGYQSSDNLTIYPQLPCVQGAAGGSGPSGCGNYNNYIPIDQSQPIKHVKVNIHVMQESMGSPQNFINQPADITFLTNWVSEASYIWSHNTAPIYNGTPTLATYYGDSRIQFDLQSINFDIDHNGWDRNNSSPGSDYCMNNFGTNTGSEINIFVFETYEGWNHCSGNTNNFGSNTVNMQGLYSDWVHDSYPSNYGHNEYHNYILAHEFTHNLNLHHLSDPDQFSDTPAELINVFCDANSGPYCSNNLAGENNTKLHLSPMQQGYSNQYLTQSKRNTTTYCDYDAAESYNITTNTTWDYSQIVKGDIIVTSGNTLTITCTVYMNNQGRIVVERDATLIVDGGLVTDDCGGMWQGIEVWGTPTANAQSTSADRGVVQVINGGTIENAIDGIRTVKTDGSNNYDWAYTGGIVQCENAFFINNQRAVEFLPYPSVNHSYFKYCTFETNDVMADNSIDPTVFVTMYQTQGVGFKGNLFHNVDLADYPQYYRGDGIYSIDASYDVMRSCDTLTGSDCTGLGNNFLNLDYAVQPALVAGPAYVKIDGNTFTNDYQGVTLENTIGNQVLRNSFVLRDPALYSCVNMFTMNANTYNAEKNDFTNSTANAIPHYGLVSHETGLNGAMVFLNDFDELYSCSQMQHVNDALAVDCNTYTQTGNSQYDWVVTSGHVGKQGDAISGDLRKNTFHSGATGSGESQILHWPKGSPYLYYDALISYDPIDISPEVIVSSASGSNSCTSTIGISYNPSNKLAQSNTHNGQRLAYIDSIALGDASGLYSLISNGSNSSSTVRSGLLAISPYLSDGVLIAAFNRSPALSSTHIVDIAVANSPLSELVMDTINALGLSSTYTTPINAAQTGGLTPIDSTLHKISYLYVKKQSEFNQAILQYADSMYTDSIILAFQSRGYDLGAWQALVPLLLTSDTTLAKYYIGEVDDYADSLYGVSSIDENVPALHAFADFYSMMVAVSVRPGGVFALDAGEETLVETLSETDYPIAIPAQNIRHMVHGEYYDRIPETLGGAKRENGQSAGKTKRQITVPKKNPAERANTFSVYPNPVNHTATVSYTVPVNCNRAEIAIYDLLGKKIGSLPIAQKGASQVEFNNNLTGKGVYLFNLEVDGGVIDHKKVVVIGD